MCECVREREREREREGEGEGEREREKEKEGERERGRREGYKERGLNFCIACMVSFFHLWTLPSKHVHVHNAKHVTMTTPPPLPTV